jgi:hypothetical protein
MNYGAVKACEALKITELSKIASDSLDEEDED